MNNFFGYSPSSHLNRFKIISSERFRVHEHIFSEAGLLLKYPWTTPTSTPTRLVDNVVIATKVLQDRNTNIIPGTTVENKGKFILTEIFPSVQEHDIF